MEPESKRHPGGRPRTAERSPAFHLADSLAARRRMSLATLSEIAGTTRTHLYALRDPRLSTIRKLASALGVKPGRLAELIAAVEGHEA